MVRGPWVDLLQPSLLYKTKGRQPFMTYNTTHSVTTKCRVFTILLKNLTQTWSFSPKNANWGISFPTPPSKVDHMGMMVIKTKKTQGWSI